MEYQTPIFNKYKQYLLIVMATLAALLTSACGGSGSTPSATQPPASRPTPHPQQVYVDLVSQPGLNQTGLAFLVNVNGGRNVSSARLIQDNGLAERDYISFNSESFELTSNVNINGQQLFSDLSGPLRIFQTFDEAFTNWETNGRRDLNKKILILRPGERGIGASHSSLAYWVDADAPILTVGAIILGVPISAQQIPDTGSARFSGLMRGFMTGDDQLWELHSSFDAEVNFGTGAFNGRFTDGTRIDTMRDDGSLFSSHVTDQELPDLIRTPDNFNDTFDWSLTGSIITGNNAFEGTLSGIDDGSAWTGQFTGSFFGSGRIGIPEELGGLWNATNNSGHIAGGAFIGKND
ncbi:transferrin-binding protein-like solute binding protein [Kordiimonas aquimaris]|uniref:transferrin-binding protein-like solute binding protein n=1 Tax=Kordiimonas aquimaris TaxID=707591 RepID=UPI0021D28F09|nr:transferrin-binding protein-like solute binding protein [Kordiimonas aquimaris]